MRPLAVALVMLLPPASAPADATGWWHNKDIQRQVRLTGTQVERLQRIFDRDRELRATRRQELARLERELADALVADDADGIESSHLVDRIEGLRMQINVRRTLMLIEMYRVLSKEQRQILAALHGPLIVSDR